MKDWAWLMSDFTGILPAGAQSSGFSRRRVWQIADYTTEDFSGNLIIAQPASAAPDVTVEIPLSGTYDIYLGLFQNYCDRIKVKFSDEPVFERMRHSSKVVRPQAFEEVYWRTAEFDGTRELIIRQEENTRAGIGYVMAKKHVAGPVHAKQYLLHITDDGLPSNFGVPDDGEDACWNIRAASRLAPDYVSRGVNPTSMADYPTRHESLRRDPAKMLDREFPGEIYRQVYLTLEKLFKEGFCVPKRYYELARESSMKVLTYCRMAIYHANPPWDCFYSEFYDKHPEFRCVDIDGVPVNRLSFAYPEVRREFIKLYAEGVEMGSHGASNCFVRGFPFVCYEEPVRRRFRELCGGDITKFPENDPKVEAVRAEFMTTYMRELRQALDAAGGAHRPEIMATVHGTREACSYYGLDVAAWVEEGLVDVLCPYTWGIDAFPVTVDIPYFASLLKGSKVKLLPFLGSMFDDRSPVRMLERALAMAEQPIDGFSFWDGVDHRVDPMFHMIIRSLASDGAIRDAMKRLENWPPHRPLITMQGTKINKHNYGFSM